jgi:hypothetical protein
MTRVVSNGSLKITISVIAKEMEQCGYISQ